METATQLASIRADRSSRFLRTGKADPTFGTHGYQTVAEPSPGGSGDGEAYSVAVTDSGRVFVLGSEGGGVKTRPLLMALTSNGFLDKSFGIDGVVPTKLPLGRDQSDDVAD